MCSAGAELAVAGNSLAYSHRETLSAVRVRCEGDQATVVGLVKDSKYHTPIEGPTPFFYTPSANGSGPALTFRSSSRPPATPIA